VGTRSRALATWANTWRDPEYSQGSLGSLQNLEHELASLRTRLGIPGMSAAVAEGDRIIWSRGFGTADRERAVSAGPDTIYGLASLTKPYASTVVLQLVREGRLGLDD
jgi:CubicO group peptidase (beta-lactamase class C family)